MRQFNGQFVYFQNSGKVRIFECKMCKMEKMMMGKFSGRFLYLRNFRKVAKYGI
jgi:hypothetical protein